MENHRDRHRVGRLGRLVRSRARRPGARRYGGFGFRVPLIVVSPYAKRAYISHATMNSAASYASSKTTGICPGSARPTRPLRTSSTIFSTSRRRRVNIVPIGGKYSKVYFLQAATIESARGRRVKITPITDVINITRTTQQIRMERRGAWRTPHLTRYAHVRKSRPERSPHSRASRPCPVVLSDFETIRVTTPRAQDELKVIQAHFMTLAQCAARGMTSAADRDRIARTLQERMARYGASPEHIARRQVERFDVALRQAGSRQRVRADPALRRSAHRRRASRSMSA